MLIIWYWCCRCCCCCLNGLKPPNWLIWNHLNWLGGSTTESCHGFSRHLPRTATLQMPLVEPGGSGDLQGPKTVGSMRCSGGDWSAICWFETTQLFIYVYCIHMHIYVKIVFLRQTLVSWYDTSDIFYLGSFGWLSHRKTQRLEHVVILPGWLTWLGLSPRWCRKFTHEQYEF